MSKVFFVTGTDTDAGKTVATRTLIDACVQAGFRTAGYKPVASGSTLTAYGMRNSDALFLQAASNPELHYEAVNPFTFEPPIAPHIAASQAGVEICTDKLSSGLYRLQEQSDVVFVEGAGGWRVPLSDSVKFSDWVRQENLPVILVVGMKLGCLNHAMLTAETIVRDGLFLAGWIANRVDPEVSCYAENLAYLAANLPAPKLGEIPYLPDISKRDLTAFIDQEQLKALMS
ncbi:ATP-dependent dethiobiotin synthetase BioD [Photobacterium sp. GJ3]|uniref:dethiobiotin synthase n=1 Tax=Photobacterium sp. GJ3 TaxID=2829502 RepID=UPI001B8B53B0|nr:dethiobiotin synthase [Photobacterium sp. GJ3]QUJ68490.1 ATP-dependent dethiobiotin synthetase BioD [Photobacterium sp. GJ3]